MNEIDPVTMATQLATAYTQAAQERLNAQTKAAQNMSSALTSLRSALSSFDSALQELSRLDGLRSFSATLSASDVGTASASATAQPGTYSFHVEQLATAHQIIFENLPALAVADAGTLTVQLADGTSFDVDLSAADLDGDGSISQSEVARAINDADGNDSKVTAAVMTAGGQTHLLLSATETGASHAIALLTSSLPASAFRDALDAGRELSAAQDAVIWLGGQGGVRVQQASNTFTGIEGVSVTFTRAMSATESPVTLTVADDHGGTADNVKKFVEAFNALIKEIDQLTKAGDPNTGTSAAAFASDAGVRTLRQRLNEIIRQDFGGFTLVDLGVRANRDGTLSLDESKLQKRLQSDPDALDQVFGQAGLTGASGLLGALDEYLDQWLDVSSGYIASRQASVQRIQKSLSDRQMRLDAQFESAYQRYLKQFTDLQALQAQMSQTSGLFGVVGLQ